MAKKPIMHDPRATSEYVALLASLEERVRAAQLRVVESVNTELVLLYWEMGSEILVRQEELGWGAKVVDQLSFDLRRAFPEVRGFSSRNLKYMRAFANAWPDRAIVQEPLARIPWYHNLTLLEKLEERQQRLWYVRQVIEHGWSRNILVAQIESGLYRRQGKAITNFERTLPASQSDLAQQTLKDPYTFDFLSLSVDIRERDLERALVHHIRDFLLELGVGFGFLGTQVHLEVAGEDFYVDMLFYHVRLHRYVVIELKSGEFQPEHAGKMSFYLSAVDDLLRQPEDGSTIGLLLCKRKNRVIVEYALRGTDKPIGVSEWQLTRALPEELEGSLPTVESLETELGHAEGDD